MPEGGYTLCKPTWGKKHNAILHERNVKTLTEELRLARLKIELQDFMVNISSKEFGIDLQKKHGTTPSK